MVKKVFISYAWTNEEHKNRILNIASSLVEDHGINIILDLWDCLPGQDLNAFMESMVLDQTVDYVLMMSDGKYKNKANNREGGVGTESTIISSEIYKDVSATKFIPVAMEIENGEFTLPQFCKSRRAINMTNEDNDYEGIEEIARWINGQPVYTKPKLGTVPDYNSKSTSIKKYEQKVFLSKTYNLEDNLHDYYKVLETELLELEDEQDEVSDQEILKIKPYIESFIKVFSYILDTEIDSTSYILDIYNRLLKNAENEYSRPLLRLFLYFSYLELVLILISRNNIETLKNIILSDYIFYNRKFSFGVLSSFPRKYQEHPFFKENGYYVNVRRYCLNLLYDEMKRNKLGDIDIILNTVSTINPKFKKEINFWHGTLLYFDINEYYSWENKKHYIVEKFKYKDFYERYKFLFGYDREALKSILKEQDFNSHNLLPMIDKVLKIDEIGSY